MKTIYISYPYIDGSDENKEKLEKAKAEFEAIKQKLQEYDKDAFIWGSSLQYTEDEEHLAWANECFLLAISDAVYFIDDWKNYRFCRCQHVFAEEYGIPIILL